jgi:pimeloyl-ACP methyl ester carboxylesterase
MPPPRKPSSRWSRRFRRAGLGVLAVLLAGAVFEQIGAWSDLRRFPPPGTRIDLGDGRRMYLDCRGTGLPTVVLEAGHRNWSPAWMLVEPEIAKVTRVCSYDRAGLGLSDTGPRPRVVGAVAADLERLLHAADVAPPYVLVGHSAGGMYQRVFAASHREQVVGLVLVDSDEPTDEADRLSVETAPDDRTTAAVLTVLTHIGLLRFLDQVLRLKLGPPFPEEAKIRLRAGMTRMGRAINDEWDLYRSAYRAVANDPLGDLPLVVIAALGYQATAQDKADWRRRQTQLAALSTKGKLVVLEDEAHYLPLLRPEVVIGAIREVVEAARETDAGPKR